MKRSSLRARSLLGSSARNGPRPLWAGASALACFGCLLGIAACSSDETEDGGGGASGVSGAGAGGASGSDSAAGASAGGPAAQGGDGAAGGDASSTAGAAGSPDIGSGGSTSGAAGTGGTVNVGSAGTSGGTGTSGSGGVAGKAGAGGSGGRDFSTNRDAFFGDSRCATAKVQFCESFESGTLDPATWKAAGRAPVIDGMQHARGSKALHVTQSRGSAKISTSKVFPAKNGRYWGRAFVYLNAMPHQSASADSLGYSHWTILAASGAKVAGEVRLGGQLQRRYQNATAQNFWGVGTDNRKEAEGSGDWTNSDDDPKGAAKPVVEKQWQCLEWMGDYMTDETKFFLDGVEHPSLATNPQTKHGGTNKPFLLPEFNAIWFGWTEYQVTTQQFELWFDEIAIDPERIGCVL